MKWDSEYGTWSLLDTKWLGIRGTTFRNAGYFVIEFVFNDDDYSLAFSIGNHIGVEWWLKETCAVYEWKPKKCKCYGCTMRMPLSPELKAALFKKFFGDKE